MTDTNHRLNGYVCGTCSDTTLTYHVDEGTTPMFLACRARGVNPVTHRPVCGGEGVSLMYDVEPADYAGQPRYAWYKPSRAESLTLSPATAQHVELGGVLLRDQPDPAP